VTTYTCCYNGCTAHAVYAIYSDIPPQFCPKHAQQTETKIIERVRQYNRLLCSSKLVVGESGSKWLATEAPAEQVETGGDILSQDAATRALLQVNYARKRSADDIIAALRDAGFAIAIVRSQDAAA